MKLAEERITHKKKSIVTFPKNEIQMIFINETTRINLEKYARKYGVTMSWIIRTVLFTYKKKYSVPPEVIRPRKFYEKMIRFNICFYKNKNDWQVWVHSGGKELGPVVRYILELWEVGRLDIDFDDIFTIKEHFQVKFMGKKSYRYGFQYRFHGMKYEKNDYWPKNRIGNIFLMDFGIRNRIYALSILK